MAFGAVSVPRFCAAAAAIELATLGAALGLAAARCGVSAGDWMSPEGGAGVEIAVVSEGGGLIEGRGVEGVVVVAAGLNWGDGRENGGLGCVGGRVDWVKGAVG